MNAAPQPRQRSRIFGHPIVKYVLAPLLVLLIWYFLLKGIEGCGGDGGPNVRIDVAASMVNPFEDTAAAEYVCLVNEGDSAVSLTGWKLSDAERTVNVLPRFSLAPDAKVRVHPGGGGERADTKHDLFGEAGTSWNNEGDTVTLLDSEGAAVDSVTYGNRDDGEVRGNCGPAS